jgi:hypothetical protein
MTEETLITAPLEIGIMTPFITINGDKRRTLVDDRAAILPVLRELMERLSQTNPNGRNYIGQGEAYGRDRTIYANRVIVVKNLYDDILHEAMAIQKGGER